MARCKTCGRFKGYVCVVDEDYEESIRQEMQELAESKRQIEEGMRKFALRPKHVDVEVEVAETAEEKVYVPL